MRNYFRLLSREDLQKVHNASMRILETIGMVIDHLGARKMLEETGAKIDHAKKIVKFPPELVEQSLKNVPRTLVFAGRKPNNDMLLKPGGDFYVRTSSGQTSYVDLRTGEYRRARIDDMREFAILGDALPNINGNGTLHAVDVPEQTADIHSLRVLLENTEKHLYAAPFGVKNLQYMVEMMLAIRGGREEVRKRPPFHIVIGIISPLFIPEDNVDMLLLAGEYGIPTGMCVMPNAGATAPMTLAGTLAQANAEMLGGFTLSQIAHPGQPLPYYWIPTITDMRRGTDRIGGPEATLLNAALCQLGMEFYGMPVMAGGLFADTAIGQQLVLQKTQMGLVTCLAGANLIIGAGTTDNGLAFSPVQLVIDDEIVGITRRIWRGLEVNDDTLGLDVIKRVGPRGNFLIDEHTLRYLRTDEHFYPTIFGYESQAVWYSKGAKDLEYKAKEKAFTILQDHKVESLSEDVLRELKSIVKNADTHLAK